MGDETIFVGAVEEVLLLPWGVKMPARIDTGAATTSIDARELVVKENIARFRLPERYGGQAVELPVVDYRHVRSAGHRAERPIVEIELCIGPKRLKVRANLNDRSRMRYPMIIGRNVLEYGFIVDCTKTHHLKPTCGEEPRR